MSEIIPFDFEEQAVRVIMREEEPWFVAADVCRVLEHSNPTMAMKGLDEDEVTLSQIEGSHRPTNLISESGLYALVIRSDKPAARRFRKWITAEVLPAIRRHGRYEMVPEAPAAPGRSFEEMTARDWLAMIREARILGGAPAGRRIWSMSPLPPLVAGRAVAMAVVDPAEAQACLNHLAQFVGGVAEDDPDLNRIGLRILPQGLFVANAAQAFNGTRWAGGAHRPVLLSLPGVLPDTTARTLAGLGMRGIVVPFALIGGDYDA